MTGPSSYGRSGLAVNCALSQDIRGRLCQLPLVLMERSWQVGVRIIRSSYGIWRPVRSFAHSQSSLVALTQLPSVSTGSSWQVVVLTVGFGCGRWRQGENYGRFLEIHVSA